MVLKKSGRDLDHFSLKPCFQVIFSNPKTMFPILISAIQMMRFKLRWLKLRRNHRLQKRERKVQHMCSAEYQTVHQVYYQFFLLLDVNDR